MSYWWHSYRHTPSALRFLMLGIWIVLILLLGVGLIFSGQKIWTRIQFVRGTPEQSVERIRLSYRMGDLLSTRGLITDFLLQYPQSPLRNEVQVYASKVLISQNKPHQAVEMLYPALSQGAQESYYIEAVFLLAEAYEKADWPVDKVLIAHMENAYFSGSDSDRLRLASLIGDAAFAIGDTRTALSYYENAKPKDSLLGLSKVYATQGNYDTAMDLYAQFLELYPRDTNAPVIQAQLIQTAQLQGSHYLKQNRTNAAIAAYTRIIRSFPASKEANQALLIVGEIYEEVGRVDTALSYYQALLDRPSQEGRFIALNRIGKILYAQGRFTEALASFLQALREEPTHKDAKIAMQWIDLIRKAIQYQ